MNPVRQLLTFGQSPWLDYIQRALFTSGDFQRLIDEDGIRGVTSNPAILAKAVRHPEYREAIARLRPDAADTPSLYEALIREEIQLACDALRPVWEETEGVEGLVSLEVAPDLAWETEATIREALRLAALIDRPNLMIKVPATRPGLEAIRRLTAQGINVNATLIFSPGRYLEVARAWQAGMEERLRQDQPMHKPVSVASFFVSRIETLADDLLEAASEHQPESRDLIGRIALAAARRAYSHYLALRHSDAWVRLLDAGAHPQRLLWASTSTKNPAYSDVKYVDGLVGPETIDTLPPATLDAYRDHGHPAPRLEPPYLEEAAAVLEAFAALGFDIEIMAERLELEGVEKFQLAWEKLMNALEAA